MTDAFETDTEYALVAEVNGEVAGFALGTTLDKLLKLQQHAQYGYLIWLAVSPTFQRLRIGHKLYHAFKEKVLARRIYTILVDTQADNTQAIAFFKNLGFTETEKFFYFQKAASQRNALEHDDDSSPRKDDDDDNDDDHDDEDHEEDQEEDEAERRKPSAAPASKRKAPSAAAAGTRASTRTRSTRQAPASSSSTSTTNDKPQRPRRTTRG